MEVDETKTGINTSDNRGEYTERMAPETSFQNMAPDTEASSEMDNSKRGFTSIVNTARTEPARYHLLSEAVQIEHVQEEKPQRVCSELPQCHRWVGGDTTDKQRQDRGRIHGRHL
jgi:hypothetical protein